MLQRYSRLPSAQFEADGVFVCLVKLIGYCKKHADQYAQKTGRHYFVNITQKKLLVPPRDRRTNSKKPKKKPSQSSPSE